MVLSRCVMVGEAFLRGKVGRVSALRSSVPRDSALSIRARACNSARSRDPSMPLRLSAQTKDSGGEARKCIPDSCVPT